MLCSFCKEEINRPLDPRSENHFCSRSCSAKFNNKLHPKREKITYYCKDCGNVVTKKAVRCKECARGIGTSELVKNTTVGQLKELYKDKNALAYAAKIRGYGKTIYENSDRPKKCIVCSYDKHYEVCHLKAVSSFSDNATMAEVHAVDNLVALCPNCHWELDHGFITGDDIVNAFEKILYLYDNNMLP